MSVNDNIMDIRVRFHRDESPMLFRALSGMESAPGVRTRNQFVRQLIEMGLLMMEERMRRQDGLSIRVSSGLADEVTASVVAIRSASADPAPATSAQTSVAAGPTSNAVEAAPTEHAPAPARALQIAAVDAPVTADVARGDDDRPPPRVGGVRTVRMLDGESFE